MRASSPSAAAASSSTTSAAASSRTSQPAPQQQQQQLSTPTSSSRSLAAATAATATAAAYSSSTSSSRSLAAALIDATSQLSRFHLESVDPSTAIKSVDLHQVNVSVGDLPLLVDAHLQLKEGVRYGLVGRNGVGKSVLLHCLASRRLAALPPHLTVLHVAQEAEGGEDTPLQVVMATNARGEALQRDIDMLEEALAAGDPAALAAAAAALSSSDAASVAATANAKASTRSGRRGVAARKAALAAEKEAAAVAGRGVDAGAAEEAVQALLLSRYEQLAELEDTAAAEGRATTILTGLGFDRSKLTGPCSALSGGWRMRVALGAALFAGPDILCLDEPTNHLDLESILWLQSWLQGMDNTTLILVSHDRAFLTAATQETIQMKDRALRYFPGPYDAFVEARAAAALSAQRQVDALAKKKKHIEDSIAAAEKAARVSGDDKKLGMVASRRKKLDNRWGMEKTADGKRFKLQKHMAGWHDSRRPQVELEKQERPFKFKWPAPPPLRHAGPLLQLHDVGYTYPGAPSPVLTRVTLSVSMGDRVVLLGPNGAGKSTLLQLLSGELAPNVGSGQTGSTSGQTMVKPPPGVVKVISAASSKPTSSSSSLLGNSSSRGTYRAPHQRGSSSSSSSTSAAARSISSSVVNAVNNKFVQPGGTIDRHPALRLGLFAQHCVEALQLGCTALEHLTATVPDLRDQEARDYLGSFGLGGRLSCEQPLRSLSGGQKARMALALVLAGRPNLLLLDEPTNHFDMETVEALGAAIETYPGAVVVVSHDVRFLEEVLGCPRVSPGGVTSGSGSDAASASTSDAAAAKEAAEEERLRRNRVLVVGDARVTPLGDPRGLAGYVADVTRRVTKRRPLSSSSGGG